MPPKKSSKLTYCVKCKKATGNSEPITEKTMKNGATGRSSICTKCKGKKFGFIKA